MGYLEQYSRMLRWYNRFQSIETGVERTVADLEYYADEVQAFFMSCDHLRDWIENDDSSDLKPEARTRENLKRFIESKECLKICIDVSNGLKHWRITRKKWSGTDQGLKPRHLHFNPSTEKIKMKFYIESDERKRDAFQIASECVDAWKEYLGNALVA